MPGTGLAKFPVLNSLQWEISTLHRALHTHRKNKKAKKPKNSTALWKNFYENGIFCSGTKHQYRNALSAHCLLIYTLLFQFVSMPRGLKEGCFL